MEGQPKRLRPYCTVTWLGKLYGVSDPTDPEVVGELRETRVTDAHGLKMR